MRKWMGIFVVATALIAGCGDEEDSNQPTDAAPSTSEEPATDTDEDLIADTAQAWASAYATQDPAYCELGPPGQRDICSEYVAGGKPSVYQTGYLNATAEEINIDGSRALVTLSNGCDIEMEEFGSGEWLVTNSGGNRLAAGCEQGTGR